MSTNEEAEREAEREAEAFLDQHEKVIRMRMKEMYDLGGRNMLVLCQSAIVNCRDSWILTREQRTAINRILEKLEASIDKMDALVMPPHEGPMQ
jgi:hypothetical protein